MSSHRSCEVIAITNQKGGVGKTTTTINLGHALAEMGHRVLMLDLDPHGSTTLGSGVRLEDVQCSIAELLRDKSLPERAAIYQGPSRLDLIPATPLLAAVVRELVGVTNSELRLVHRIKKLRANYDYILIDSSPGFGLLMNLTLNAADSLLIPVDSGYYAMAGLKKLLAEVEEIRSGYNPGLKVLGFLLTLFDPTRMSEEIQDELIGVFGDQVFETQIRRSVRLREAPALGLSIFCHAPQSHGAEDYLRLAQEVCKRVQSRTGGAHE